MIKIKISTSGGGKPFIKQLKSFNSIWGNCQFFLNEDIPECDFWVVYGGLAKEESVLCSKSNTIFITNEPPMVKKYSKKFLDQFGAIITCHKNIKHPNVIFNQQAFPWWVGHKIHDDFKDDIKYYKTYDELKSIKDIKKTKIVSMVTSNKAFTKDHKTRYDFLQKVQKDLGDVVDVFGVGFKTIEDKWDAIAPYKYHIALENTSLKDWWTEKLSDAFLGESYPIYYGCPNIYDYFSEKALAIIDINKPDEAISTIKSIIQSEIYEKSIDAIKKARELVLDKYQLFPMLCDYANKYKEQKEKILIHIKPEPEVKFKTFLKEIIKKILK